MWDHPFGTLVLARDRLIQFKLLHRVYYTPARIASIYGMCAAECCQCTTNPADFDHIFWHFWLIQEFWTGVTHTIQALFDYTYSTYSVSVFAGPGGGDRTA